MRDHRSRERTSSLISPPLIGTLRTHVANSSQSPVGLIAAAVSQGHGFESRSTFTCLKTLQFLTESAFDMRKKKTSNENKKASPFNKHHGTMHYCNVHYGLPHLTFTYPVDKYSSTWSVDNHPLYLTLCRDIY